MDKKCKIIIAGVGGQGVVYLTELLCEAAVRSGIPVATSEVHGLSQRGGSVTAGITFGKNTFGGVEDGGADFLLGLELLEAQRCINYLHRNSVAIIDDVKFFPHAVNAQKASYPDTEAFIEFLNKNIKNVIFAGEAPGNTSFIMRNIFILGKAASQNGFPVKTASLERAITALAKDEIVQETLKIFKTAFNEEKGEIKFRKVIRN